MIPEGRIKKCSGWKFRLDPVKGLPILRVVAVSYKVAGVKNRNGCYGRDTLHYPLMGAVACSAVSIYGDPAVEVSGQIAPVGG